MRVSCDQCGTGYELDLPPGSLSRGRNLKFRCTACGHRFLVVRRDGSLTEAATGVVGERLPVDPEATTSRISGGVVPLPTIELNTSARTEPPPPRGPAPAAAGRSSLDEGPFLVRQDGVVYHVDDLATLQRWIVERRLERDAELVEADGPPKSLGDQPELSLFFALVEKAGTGPPQPEEPPAEPAPAPAEQPPEELEADLPWGAEEGWGAEEAEPTVEEPRPEGEGEGEGFSDLPPDIQALAASLAADLPGSASADPLDALDPIAEEVQSPPATDLEDNNSLPPDIEALLAGLSGDEEAGETAPPPPARRVEGPAPELVEAMAALPPDIQALVAGLGEDHTTEEARPPRVHFDEPASAPINPSAPGSAGPLGLDIPQGAPTESLQWAEEEQPRSSNSLLYGLLALAAGGLLALGIWWWQGGPDPGPPSGPEASSTAMNGTNPGALPAPVSPEPALPAPEGAPAIAPPAPEPVAEPAAQPASASLASTQPRPERAAPEPVGNDPRALVSRGWKMVDKGKIDAASDYFERAATMAPTSGGAHFGLGYVAEQRGDPGTAYREYCVAWAYSSTDIELRREVDARLRAIGRSCTR